MKHFYDLFIIFPGLFDYWAHRNRDKVMKSRFSWNIMGNAPRGKEVEYIFFSKMAIFSFNTLLIFFYPWFKVKVRFVDQVHFVVPVYIHTYSIKEITTPNKRNNDTTLKRKRRKYTKRECQSQNYCLMVNYTLDTLCKPDDARNKKSWGKRMRREVRKSTTRKCSK